MCSENFSAPEDHVAMVQIDCDVTNTQPLNLHESVVPKHLRGNKKTTSNPSSRSSAATPTENASNSTKNYKPYFVKDNETSTLSAKSFNGSYTLRSKDPYTEDGVPYIIKDKFSPEFEYETKNSDYVKSDVFVPDTESNKIVYSRRGKKFRRRRDPAAR